MQTDCRAARSRQRSKSRSCRSHLCRHWLARQDDQTLGRRSRPVLMDLRKQNKTKYINISVPQCSPLAQVGHDNWIRGLVFHPSGKYLLSAADDYTVRIWDLKTGRCVKRIDAHEQFVSCITWGRQLIGEANGDGGQTINVIATGSSDKVRSGRPYSHSIRYSLYHADGEGMAAVRIEGCLRCP
jgi:WD40 repeat protein